MKRWVRLLLRVANPVLTNLAAGTLKARMPVEQAAGATRQTVTHLEAIGRLLSGIAPWLELRGDETGEGRDGHGAPIWRGGRFRALLIQHRRTS